MFWKVLFFVYLIFILVLSNIQSADVAGTGISAVAYEFFGLTYLIFGILLALVYFYALGWEKQIITPLYNKHILITAIILNILLVAFFSMEGHNYFYNDMLLYAMREGMVPRNPDFQALLWITRFEVLLYGLCYVFLLFAPFYTGYYFYTKKCSKFSTLKCSGRKIFALFILLNFIPSVLMSLLAFIEDFVAYNFFDVLSLLCCFYLVFGVCAYAFGKKILSQRFWHYTLPIFTLISFMPSTFNSGSFQKLMQTPTLQSEPVLFFIELIIKVASLYLIYKYACTDEVYGKIRKV